MCLCTDENGPEVAHVGSGLSGGGSGRSVCGGNGTADRTGTVLVQSDLIHNSGEHFQRFQDVVYCPHQVGAVETQGVGGSSQIGDETSTD